MFLKHRSELFDLLKLYKNHSENQLQVYGTKLTNIRLDRAGENLSNIVKQFCFENGISIEPSPARAPQSNGAAERLV